MFVPTGCITYLTWKYLLNSNLSETKLAQVILHEDGEWKWYLIQLKFYVCQLDGFDIENIDLALYAHKVGLMP